MPGARCTRGLVCKMENTRVSHHRLTGTPGIPCAMVLRLIPRSPLATNSSCHHRRRIGRLKTRSGSKRLRRLDTSNGCQDPHGFAVRNCAVRLARCHRSQVKDPPCDSIHAPGTASSPHPAPTFVTMANAPLNGAGRRRR